MTKKISKEIRSKIYSLHNEDKSVKEILSILRQENISISDKTIYRIIKENKKDKEKDVSFISLNESFTELENNNHCIIEFNDSFTEDKGDKEIVVFDAKEEEDKEDVSEYKKHEKEREKERQSAFEIIKNAVKEETQKVLSTINQDIAESNDKLDSILKQTKVQSKPLPKSSKPIIMFDTSGLTDQEKILRRNLIVKIRNYIDCFSDYDVVINLGGSSFKQSLYEKDMQTLNYIYEELQIGLNQSKDYENFIQLFSTSLKSLEFISNILLGINLAGLRDEVLNDIDEFTLRQLACELSVSRYISPQMRIVIVTLKAVLKKILSSDLISKHNDLKVKLYGYYQKINSFLKK